MKRPTTRLQTPTQRIRRTSCAPDVLAYEHNADDLVANRFLALGPIAQALQIRSGFDAPVLEDIASKLLHIPLRELLASLRMPRNAITRKIRLGTRLTTSESDRVARTLLIYGQAKGVLEDATLAAAWLSRSNIELRGDRPLDMMDTQPGFDRVRDLLLRIERGVGL
jgi:putative toxin-antitoxin system antitoxin component (TIGR02293 family)